MERGKLGLIVHRVNGAYDRGGKKTNEIEAHAVVDAVARHVQENPDFSLGIVTFSISQRDLIEDILEMRRRDDRDINAFMQNKQREDTFVKNLETFKEMNEMLSSSPWAMDRVLRDRVLIACILDQCLRMEANVALMSYSPERATAARYLCHSIQAISI